MKNAANGRCRLMTLTDGARKDEEDQRLSGATAGYAHEECEADDDGEEHHRGKATTETSSRTMKR